MTRANAMANAADATIMDGNIGGARATEAANRAKKTDASDSMTLPYQIAVTEPLNVNPWPSRIEPANNRVPEPIMPEPAPAEPIPSSPTTDAGDANHQAATDVSASSQQGSIRLPGIHSGSIAPLAGVLDETLRWGRDDLKRNEMGSQGESLATGVGKALKHLVGLGDEEPGLRNGEKMLSSENARFLGDVTDVGSGLDHLWLLGDAIYARASTDDPDEGVLQAMVGSQPAFGSLAADALAFARIEEGVLVGRIFDPVEAVLPVTQRSIETDPLKGQIEFKLDGTFVFTPVNGFSGIAIATFKFIDPRTQLEEKGTITITVEAVADPASISGAAATPEDNWVATPITVTLNDPDGSEEIERVVITGLPSGATLDWNTALPGSIVQQLDGAFLVTGSTPEIQTLLLSLGVSPPHDYQGRITLNVAVTTIEANVDPSLPGYLDRETVEFAYHIDVEAVADDVTATGADKVTDEDVAVHLDTLATSYGDLSDGSEVHSVEIRGVGSDAKLLNGLGVEYTSVLANDGTRTYTLSPDDVDDVYFLPPPDESGLFTGMTIVAIATEGSNGDRETASAPIRVLIHPVADPVDVTAPTQTTNEDTAVTFGDDIDIVVNDPLTQTITQVVVSGFPSGTLVTYTAVDGTTVVSITMTPGGSITFDGGTEAEIRTALATLTLTPPLQTDRNITLAISATTEDLGGVTNTQTMPMTITVAAVADGPTITGAGIDDEDHVIDLPITVARIDADGSEQYDFAEITAPADIVLTYPPTLPYGITVAITGNTVRFTPGVSTTADQFENFLANDLQVQAPADSDLNFDVSVKVGTIESVLTDGEVAVLRNDATATIPVVIRPVVDIPTVTGSSVVDEDMRVGFGADIAVSDNDRTDGSEAITRIVLGQIPQSADVTYTPQGGASVVLSNTLGMNSYTITGSETAIRDTLATFTLKPALHTDANIQVSVAITKVDATVSESETPATTTATSSHNIVVAAVADGPTVTGTATGLEDQPFDLPITVSRIDEDGSEQYTFAEVIVPAGVTLIYPGTLPNGITVVVSGNTFTFSPGVSTTATQFEAFLRNDLDLRAPSDSDVNFNVAVRLGTAESVLNDSGLSLLNAETSITIPVVMRPVIDAPLITGSSSINEDGIVNPSDQTVIGAVDFGAAISISAPDSTDTSETITQIVITGLPVGAIVSYTPIGGSLTTFTVNLGTTSLTFGGVGESEAAIRTALATLTLIPPPHSDADIPIGISVTKVDASSSEAEASVTGTFTATHIVKVGAIADIPTLNGSATGLEDQNIALALSVAHPDSTDGSETIKSVVITGVPSGFTLSESSTGSGVLTANGDGGYTVTGPSDATLNDVLAHLTLVINPANGAPRQHLDTDFSLTAVVTTIENTPSETGTGQITQLETSRTFGVPITVTAIVDGVATTGASTLVEDVAKTIGDDIQWSRIDTDGSEHVTSVVVTGFPVGALVNYTDMTGTSQSLTAVGGESITLSGPHAAATETAIRTALDTLTVRTVAETDANFSLTVAITTTDNDASVRTQTISHAVVVQAVADLPVVDADDISLNEDASSVLTIRADRSNDGDNSEVLSVRITVPSDGTGVVGTLTGTAPSGVTFTSLGSGVYTVTATGATPADRETALNGFLNSGITFTPRAQWSNVLTGTNGIKVEAISTESATGYGVELGPNNSVPDGTGGDLDTKTAIATTYIDVTVAPLVDLPVQTNATTTVRENNGSSATSDPNLVVPIGTRIGLSLTDTDSSQGLSLTLTGFPTNAQALAFTSSLSGVSTSVSIATGTVTINSTNANNVLTVLNSLSLTLADDDDRNFTVAINGTVTDTNGTSTVSSALSLSHLVTVQAVADNPTVDRGAAVRPAVDEDSDFVAYPITVSLNDIDGSETFQSIRIDATHAVYRLTATDNSHVISNVDGTVTIDGMTFTTLGDRITITGGTTAELQAVLLSLNAKPVANDGEDISISITATSVESNPSEDNNGATTGMGGGVVGTEINVPIAVTIATLLVPIIPVPEPLTLILPSPPSGVEDTTFSLGGITVSASSSDPDGSETRYIEISTTSYPTGTQFFVGSTQVGTEVTPGWLRVPESSLAALAVKPPVNFSGTFTLSIRGVTVDASVNDTVTLPTNVQTIVVIVTPVADPISTPSLSIVVEDGAVIALGADLANTATGIRANDNGTGSGNNGATEMISRVVLDFPADTLTQTYTVAHAGNVGSAVIAFDVDLRTYTITSTLITGAADVALVSQADRAQAEADIRATLTGLTVTMGPANTDLNGIVAVTVTTLDVNDGVSSTQDSAFNHDIRVEAIADTPGLAITPTISVDEDGIDIPLYINVGNSVDSDNSETLSVRITVPSDSFGVIGTLVGTPPAGLTITDQGNGVYLVQATGATNALREAALDSFLNTGTLSLDPRANWSGDLTGSDGIKVEVISTEAATGVELANNSYGGIDGLSATETVVDYIDVIVAPQSDLPTVKGAGIGLEDARISIPMSVTLSDRDGSETFVVRITGGVPAGARIYGEGGTEILPVGGEYTLSPADVAVLALQPPLHYSSPQQGHITLVTVTDVTDTSVSTTTAQSFTTNIVVEVTGVADQPGTRTITISADEDEAIGLGAAILATAGDSPEDPDSDPDLANLLVDRDGSEALSFVIGGLPSGIIPTSSVPGGVTYIGNGTWSVTADAIPTLLLPPVPNFSGENPYANVIVRAVTQELDGDQATSTEWAVTIAVNPIINAATVDGFSSWGLATSTVELQNETVGGPNVSLANVGNHVFVDNDGSEAVVSYTFDLSDLIADAAITSQLAVLPADGSGLDKLVSSFMTGTFTYDALNGTITVLANDIGGVAFDRRLFLDSNHDFTLPVSALVRDTAIIGGVPVFVDKIETGTFSVNLVGTADVPTVFAESTTGDSGTAIVLDLGGVSTDTDAALGRTPSEDVFYVLRATNPGIAPMFGLVDGTGSLIGLDFGDGSFVLTADEIAYVRLITPGGVGGTIEFELTTVATENDGDRAINSTTFEVVVAPLTGPGPGTPPLAPTVTVGVNDGLEDGTITLNVTAQPAPGDTTNPVVSVLISNLPAGTQVFGAILLPPTHPGDAPRWVASADAINTGLVSVRPPADFSGTLTMTVEGFARNGNLQSTTSGPVDVPVIVDPVADGVRINASPENGLEDVAVDLNISLGERDVDGNEVIDGPAYVSPGNGATLVGTYDLVVVGDPDAMIDGQSLVGYYRVPVADLATLQLLPANNWHGAIAVSIASFSREPDDDNDGDNIKLTVSSVTVNVTAVADAPTVHAPTAPQTGSEDVAIALTGLTANLVDTVTANGAEVLSVKIEDVPFGSVFSEGSNNGDGSWTIPVSALATLTITPPSNYSGTMTLTLTAIALELVNGEEAQSSIDFTVVVEPKADTVEVLAKNIVFDHSLEAQLDLNVRMADNTGALPDENAAELLQISFSNVPAGVDLIAPIGGALINVGIGSWQFLGTEAEANSITAQLVGGTVGGNYTVLLSIVTIDGGDALGTAVTDSFRLTVPQSLNGTVGADSLTGTVGTQYLFGLGGGDRLDGGGDADHLVGSTGNDTYVVDNAGDVIVELVGEGTDTVETSLANFSLVGLPGLENLTFTGTGSFVGTGNALNNVINGGAASDTLTGGAGSDTFAYQSGHVGGSVDTITDFTPGTGGDRLDLSAVLTGYTPGVSALLDFVRVNQTGSDTTVSVDVDGNGDNFQILATLQGVTGLDPNTMLTNGNLIV
jgi:hypothetical protein